MMKRFAPGLAVVAAVSLAAVAVAYAQAVGQGGSAAPADSRPAVTKAEYERWKTELSNWGRWGKDDQLREHPVEFLDVARRGYRRRLAADGCGPGRRQRQRDQPAGHYSVCGFAVMLNAILMFS
jgi:hypothetical protein